MGLLCSISLCYSQQAMVHIWRISMTCSLWWSARIRASPQEVTEMEFELLNCNSTRPIIDGDGALVVDQRGEVAALIHENFEQPPIETMWDGIKDVTG